jgi:O-antigen/teichoic acid export membrane protein
MPSAPPTASGAPSSQTGDAATPLKRLAMRGAIWTMLGFGTSQMLRLGFNLIVTRLLYPELFGLISIVFTVVTGLALFCDAGIEPGVIRDPRGGEPDFLNTAWTMQIVRGFGIAVFCALIAWPVSLFYADRRLLWILPVIGLANLASGFNSTSLLTLRRNMRIRQLVTVEIGTQILSGAVMIVWARLSPTYWALVAGAVAAAAIRMAWSHWLLSERHDRLMWERRAVHELLHFGRWVWISSILLFLAAQIDRLILGKLVSWQTLGIYGLAAAIAEVPRTLVGALNNDVIYPSFAKSVVLPRAELRARIVRHRWPLLVVMAVGIAALAVIGDGVMRFLYDKRYASGAWMLPVLALGIWPSALAGTVDSSLFAIGQPRYAASANLLKTLFTAIGLPIGFLLMGTAGAVLVVAMNDLPYYGRIAHGLWREGLSTWQQDLKATLLLAAILALGLLIRSALNLGTPLDGRF